MQKLDILCDMDGILVDLTPYWLDLIAKETGVRVLPDEINQWSIHKCADLANLDPKTQVYHWLHRPGFFLNAPPIPGAIERFKKLGDDGHELYIASSPSSPISAKEKLEWLEKWCPFVKFDQVFLGNKKVKIDGDVLIDDHPETLVKWEAKHPGSMVVGIEYPYNRHIVGEMGYATLAPDYAHPEQAWDTIVSRITQFAKWLEARP